jgi:hypothetical protein
LYPGVEKAEVHYFQKQIRATTIDIFGQSDPPPQAQPDDSEVAQGESTAGQLAPEEVWQREYDKWFPAVTIQAVEGEPGPGKQEADQPDLQGGRPSQEWLEDSEFAEAAGVLEWVAEYRRGHAAPDFSTSGMLVGGALLMAAVSTSADREAQRRRLLEEALASETEDPAGPRISRLRRKIRQIL